MLAKSRADCTDCAQVRFRVDQNDAKTRRAAPLGTPSNFTANATKDISGALTALLADIFALYVKTKLINPLSKRGWVNVRFPTATEVSVAVN